MPRRPGARLISLDLYARDKVEEDIYEEKNKQYELEKARLVKDLNSLDSNKIDVLKNIADVLRSIRNFSDLYHISNAEDRGKLLRTAIDIIYIDYDKAKKEIRQIHIEWNEVWRVILDPDLLRYKDILVIKQKGMLPR